MKRYLKAIIPMVLILTLLVGLSALAAGNVGIDFTNLGLGFASTDMTQAAGTAWRVRIDQAKNYGVGIVFLSDKDTWASPLYTYNSTTTGWRSPRPYSSNAPSGTDIYWRMRQDNSYSNPFSCYGIFEP